jgi:ABC-type polysaccharide/polyol phosphate transport system ATPase subunit
MQSASPTVPAVLVDAVSKTFHLPHERSHTLKERALHPFRRGSGDRFRALSNVSFAVEPGEFFGIVGRNGSGKSTLLKCLAGIDSGAIYVDGRVSTFIELGVGFNPDLAARDNVVLNSIMLGVSPRAARERFDDIIAFAELEEFVDLKIKNYSSGMLVRLAFATAIQADADILLIDEVLAVGDAAFQQKCFDVFNGLKAAGKTILFVTHDMATVKRYCDRAMLLERGEMVLLDEPDEVARRYLHLNFDREGAVEEEGTHWRGGETRILEAWIEDNAGTRRNTFLNTEVSVLKARVRFEQDMADPNFNVVWVNAQGDNVFAVSTAANKEGTGGFRAGAEILVGISFLTALAPGRYDVTMNVSRQGTGNEIVERWDRMASVLVGNPAAGGGLVDLPHHFEIHRLPAAPEPMPAPEVAT